MIWKLCERSCQNERTAARLPAAIWGCYTTEGDRSVAQPGSASVWGTGGRGFKSRRSDQFWSARADTTG